jgi:hypothetical protein
MATTNPPHDSLTLARLNELLAAYGASPERWPADERELAMRLIAASPAARAACDDAAAVDRLLDAASMPEAPSAALRARVLASAPQRRLRPAWQRPLAAGLPLAAAAVLVLWLATARERPEQQVAAIPLNEIGVYTSPTDVLLGSYGVDVYDAAIPSIGCADSDLGCPRVDATVEPYSQDQPPEDVLA